LRNQAFAVAPTDRASPRPASCKLPVHGVVRKNVDKAADVQPGPGPLVVTVHGVVQRFPAADRCGRTVHEVARENGVSPRGLSLVVVSHRRGAFQRRAILKIRRSTMAGPVQRVAVARSICAP
jgi:hypothetical protein